MTIRILGAGAAGLAAASPRGRSPAETMFSEFSENSASSVDFRNARSVVPPIRGGCVSSAKEFAF